MAAGRIGKIAGFEALLHVHGAANGFYRALKLGQDSIARSVEDAAAATIDELGEYGAISLEAAEGLLLVLGDQAAVAGDVRCENDGDLPFHARPLKCFVRMRECSIDRLPGASADGLKGL